MRQTGGTEEPTPPRGRWSVRNPLLGPAPAGPGPGRTGIVLAQVVVVVLFAALGLRLWYLQVPMADHYRELAEANHHQELAVPATRGQILDSSGRVMVGNRTELVVSADHHELRAMDDGGERVLTELSEIIDVPVPQLQQRMRLCGPEVQRPCWPGSPYQPITLAEDVEQDVALQVMERSADLPGITAAPQALREHPYGEHAGQVLGYLQPATEEDLAEREELRARSNGVEQVGRDGLEAVYDHELRGTPGQRVLGVNNHGEAMGVVAEHAPVAGRHLITHLDMNVQKAAETALAEGMDRARAENTADSGAAVVLDVNTGGVVAMASLPAYDPAVWAGGVDQETFDDMLSEEAGEPMLSRAVQGTYPPGSTFKAASMLAAVEDGADLEATYACPGSVTLSGQTYENFEGTAQGTISLERAIADSCNTVFYEFGHRMWQKDGGLHPEGEPDETMAETARDLGFGSPTGIDLPHEADGRVPDREWKRNFWEQTREDNCERAEKGYPDVEDPSAAAYLERLAHEHCVEGFEWRAGEAVNFAIGQGDVLVSPLQLAAAYAAVANGGTVHEPRVVRALAEADGSGVRELEPTVKSELPTDDETLAYLQGALVEVTESGTGRSAFEDFPRDEIPVAGKTGSADAEGRESSSWFASYAPADDPQYAVVVLVSQGGTGAETAAPVAAQIYKGIYGLSPVEGAEGVERGEPVLPDGRPHRELPSVGEDGSVQPLDAR